MQLLIMNVLLENVLELENVLLFDVLYIKVVVTSNEYILVVQLSCMHRRMYAKYCCFIL